MRERCYLTWLPMILVITGGWVSGKVFAAPVDPGQLALAERMLLYQRANGGWPKNYGRADDLDQQARESVLADKHRTDTTFDNGATHSELAHLAKVYTATGEERYRQAFLRGLDFTLAAQYENGGWPQFYPDPRGYQTHITFNDDAMVGVLRLLRAIAQGGEPYAFVDRDRRERCVVAVECGVECILQCQIEVDGRKTAWCAQHDAVSFAPQSARTYELRSISGSESVSIVRYLMEIDDPSPEVVEAVQGAVAWFDEVKLTGIRVEKREDDSTPRGYDKVVVDDPSAPPLWARFYTVEENRPIFCSRDGIPRATLAEISYERRNGYSWYSTRAAKLLNEEYPAWQRRWAPGRDVLGGSAFDLR